MTLNDVYIDIPYMTDALSEEENNPSAKTQSAVSSLWYRSHSASPSPSSSFRDDSSALLKRKHTVPIVFVSVQPFRTSSLDDVRDLKRADSCECRGISRNSSGQRSQRSRRKGSNASERRSSVRSSVRSNRSRKGSYGLERTRSQSNNGRRASGNVLMVTKMKTEDDVKRERRHRIAVWLVLGSFIFIALSSILVVIITLTHQSEHSYDVNNTLLYYTFARPSSLP